MLFHNCSVFIYSTVAGHKCEINIKHNGHVIHMYLRMIIVFFLSLYHAAASWHSAANKYVYLINLNRFSCYLQLARVVNMVLDPICACM